MAQVPDIGQVHMNTLPSFLNLARTNLYQVFITPGWGTVSDNTGKNFTSPFLDHISKYGYAKYGLLGFSNDFQNELGLLCSEASLPASTYATSEVKDNFMGVSQEFAHTRINTDVDFTFYIDREYKVLGFFEAWMDYISGGSELPLDDENIIQSGNYYRRFNYPDYYKNSGVFIKKFEKNWMSAGAANISYQLINAFPKSMASIPVSYGEGDLMKVTVTMNYDRYIMRRERAVGQTVQGVYANSDGTYTLDLIIGGKYTQITVDSATYNRDYAPKQKFGAPN